MDYELHFFPIAVDNPREIEDMEKFEADLIVSQDTASDFIQNEYQHGNYGAIPECPEDFVLIRDGYRSREPDSVNSPSR